MEQGNEPHRVAERVARESYGRLVAFLAARIRDLASAEDALAEAFATALRDWSAKGIPDNPDGWLMAVAKRKLIDAARRRQTARGASEHLKLMADELATEEAEIPDTRLGLMFACAHPAIDPGIRAPLILQTLLGLEAAEIASAFLIAPTTMGQRLVRAKAKIKDAGIQFRIPDREEFPERLGAVLDALYAAYSRGWSDAEGTDSRGLTEEAIWLARMTVSLLPSEPEALGLLSLMLYAEARRAARRTTDGAYVPLSEQDTALWDDRMIDEAEALLRRASAGGPTGRFQLEAAVQSAHTARRNDRPTDWHAIAHLYGAILTMTGSPVVGVNQAVAIAEAEGPAAGLDVLDTFAADPRLAEYQPYWAARADLLRRLDRSAEARDAYAQAIGLESDPAVRAFLGERRDTLRPN